MIGGAHRDTVQADLLLVDRVPADLLPGALVLGELLW